MLDVTEVQQKLPPYVLYKWNTMAKEKFPQGITLTGPKKWLDD
jgi:hypothetical protein